MRAVVHLIRNQLVFLLFVIQAYANECIDVFVRLENQVNIEGNTAESVTSNDPFSVFAQWASGTRGLSKESAEEARETTPNDAMVAFSNLKPDPVMPSEASEFANYSRSLQWLKPQFSAVKNMKQMLEENSIDPKAVISAIESFGKDNQDTVASVYNNAARDGSKASRMMREAVRVLIEEMTNVGGMARAKIDQGIDPEVKDEQAKVEIPKIEDPEKEDSGGKESGGKESEGKESGGKEPDGNESGGKESGGKESSGKESSGKESGGKESGGKESGGKESGGKEAGGKEFGGKEFGGKESGGKESGGKESGGKEAGGKESGGKESGGKEAGGKEAGGKESGGKESGGKESGGKESGGKESGGKESGGKESGGKESSGKESSGKESSGKEPDGNESSECAGGSCNKPSTSGSQKKAKKNPTPGGKEAGAGEGELTADKSLFDLLDHFLGLSEPAKKPSSETSSATKPAAQAGKPEGGEQGKEGKSSEQGESSKNDPTNEPVARPAEKENSGRSQEKNPVVQSEEQFQGELAKLISKMMASALSKFDRPAEMKKSLDLIRTDLHGLESFERFHPDFIANQMRVIQTLFGFNIEFTRLDHLSRAIESGSIEGAQLEKLAMYFNYVLGQLKNYRPLKPEEQELFRVTNSWLSEAVEPGEHSLARSFVEALQGPLSKQRLRDKFSDADGRMEFSLIQAKLNEIIEGGLEKADPWLRHHLALIGIKDLVQLILTPQHPPAFGIDYSGKRTLDPESPFAAQTQVEFNPQRLVDRNQPLDKALYEFRQGEQNEWSHKRPQVTPNGAQPGYKQIDIFLPDVSGSMDQNLKYLYRNVLMNYLVEEAYRLNSIPGSTYAVANIPFAGKTMRAEYYKGQKRLRELSERLINHGTGGSGGTSITTAMLDAIQTALDNQKAVGGWNKVRVVVITDAQDNNFSAGRVNALRQQVAEDTRIEFVTLSIERDNPDFVKLSDYEKTEKIYRFIPTDMLGYFASPVVVLENLAQNAKAHDYAQAIERNIAEKNHLSLAIGSLQNRFGDIPTIRAVDSLNVKLEEIQHYDSKPAPDGSIHSSLVDFRKSIDGLIQGKSFEENKDLVASYLFNRISRMTEPQLIQFVQLYGFSDFQGLRLAFKENEPR